MVNLDDSTFQELAESVFSQIRQHSDLGVRAHQYAWDTLKNAVRTQLEMEECTDSPAYAALYHQYILTVAVEAVSKLRREPL